jgi:hypothetical protein
MHVAEIGGVTTLAIRVPAEKEALTGSKQIWILCMPLFILPSSLGDKFAQTPFPYFLKQFPRLPTHRRTR